MLSRRSLTIPVILLILLPGCNRAANEAITREAARSGVYALTAAGLVEIAEYGTYVLDPFSQQVSFNFGHSVRQVAAPTAFVTNLPGAAMAEAKVFLLPSLDAGKWHRHVTVQDDSKPIPSDSDAISGSVYKVTPDLPKAATGFLCLWVKMSETEERLYALQIK